MDRRTFSVWTVLVGLIVGCFGTLFFYGKTIGLSVPLFTLVVIAAVLLAARVTKRQINLRNTWPFIPLLFFTAMVAVRADWSIIALNLLAAMALGSLVLHYLLLQKPIDGDSFFDYVRYSALSAFMIALTPLFQALDALGWMREQRPLQHGSSMSSIMRGLLFTLPVLCVFGVLLSSADAVFANLFNYLQNFLNINGLEQIFDQTMFVGILGWFACGTLAYGVARFIPATAEAPQNVTRDDDEDDGEPILAGGMPIPAGAAAGVNAAAYTAVAPVQIAARVETPAKRQKKHPFTLGMIEAVMMLGAVDLMFGVFVLIQFAYFFGGQANISVEGLTYSQYARRGFFELVAVSVMTLGLVLWLDWVTVRHSQKQHRLFRILAVVIVALTGVMLFSASQRMTLYEQAYGFTHLRVYTHVFMFWMAVLFGVFLLALFRVRDQIFSVGLLLVIIGYLGTLNVMNVEGTIADLNVQRYFDVANEEDIDICYLRTLSLDAFPAMMTLYERAEPDSAVKWNVAWWLSQQLYNLDYMTSADSIFAYNAARVSARTQLEALRGELPEYRTESLAGDEYRYCYTYGSRYE